MSALVSSPIVKWLFPVRREGESEIHFVKRNGAFRFDHDARALCGRRGKANARGELRWQNAQKSHARVCNFCHAQSCAEPTRVAWS